MIEEWFASPHPPDKTTTRGTVHVTFHISHTSLLCGFSICTSASQHVFVAQKAVMWAAAFGRDSFSASAKASCMAQCHRHPLHLPSSPVPEPHCPGNCGGGQDLVVAPRVVEGHKRAVMNDGGLPVVWAKLIYKVSGFEEDLRLLEIFIPGSECIWRPQGSWNLSLFRSTFCKVSSSKKKNQKDWSSGEVFFFSWQQWHGDRRSSAAEAPAAALSGSEAQRTSRLVYQNTVPWLQGMDVCVCNIWMCAWVSYSILKRLKIQHLNLSTLLQSVLLASHTDSSCVYICPCVYIALLECVCVCVRQCAGELPEQNPPQIPHGLKHISKW